MMATQKTSAADKLLYKKKNGWDGLKDEELKKVMGLSETYKKFLNAGKTERECMDYIAILAEKAGYKPLNKASRRDKQLFLSLMMEFVALLYISMTRRTWLKVF